MKSLLTSQTFADNHKGAMYDVAKRYILHANINYCKHR